MSQEMNALQKINEKVRKSQATLEEEAASLKDIVHRAFLKISTQYARQKGGNSSSLQLRNGTGGVRGGAEDVDIKDVNVMHDFGVLIEWLHHLENERKVRLHLV